MITTRRAEFRSLTTGHDSLPLVDAGAVLIKEQISVDEMMYGDYLRKAKAGVAEASRCTYVVAPYAFMSKLRGFIYPKGSKIAPLFDSALTIILQAGIVDYLEKKYLPSTKICPLNLQSKDRQLRNSDLMMTYMIMVAGMSAALAVFIGEFFLKRYVFRGTKGKDGKSKRKKTKFQKDPQIHNYDDSRPPPYESIFGRNSKFKVTDTSKTRIINGREYLVIDAANGDTRLIPVRTPSAFLYQLHR